MNVNNKRPLKKAKPAKSQEEILKTAMKGYQEQVVQLTVVYHKLIELALTPHGGPDHPHPQPWLAADRLDQEALYILQQNFATLLGEMGHILGPYQEQVLVEKLPWAFKAVEAASNG